jgi:hypothetical protein
MRCRFADIVLGSIGMNVIVIAALRRDAQPIPAIEDKGQASIPVAPPDAESKPEAENQESTPVVLKEAKPTPPTEEKDPPPPPVAVPDGLHQGDGT